MFRSMTHLKDVSCGGTFEVLVRKVWVVLLQPIFLFIVVYVFI